MTPLRYNTVTPLLRRILTHVMAEPLFNPFVLVGGTNISLRYGHRQSDDIDLFTASTYGSLDYSLFESFFKENYPYFDCPDKSSIIGPGRTYYVGMNKENCVKIDLWYHDNFILPYETIGGIRMASIEDIVAMKVDVLSRKGRKKDFWDLHLLHDTFNLHEMIQLHSRANEYTHDYDEVAAGFNNFKHADGDPNPRCNLNKDWDMIKLDFIGWADDEL